jgi:hypothetical protein
MEAVGRDLRADVGGTTTLETGREEKLSHSVASVTVEAHSSA